MQPPADLKKRADGNQLLQSVKADQSKGLKSIKCACGRKSALLERVSPFEGSRGWFSSSMEEVYNLIDIGFVSLKEQKRDQAKNQSRENISTLSGSTDRKYAKHGSRSKSALAGEQQLDLASSLFSSQIDEATIKSKILGGSDDSQMKSTSSNSCEVFDIGDLKDIVLNKQMVTQGSQTPFQSKLASQ